MDNWISSQSSQTISVDASAEKYSVQCFSCYALILHYTAGDRMCSFGLVFLLFYGPVYAFFFLFGMDM